MKVVTFALACLVLAEAAPAHHSTLASSASAASTLVPDANSHTDTLIPWSTIDSIIIEDIPIVPMQEIDPAIFVPNHAVDRVLYRHQRINKIQGTPISEPSHQRVSDYITNPEIMVPVPEYLIEKRVGTAEIKSADSQEKHKTSIKSMVAGLFDDILEDEEDELLEELEKDHDHTRIFVGMDDKGNRNRVRVPVPDFFDEDEDEDRYEYEYEYEYRDQDQNADQERVKDQDKDFGRSFVRVNDGSSAKINQSKTSGNGHRVEHTVYVSNKGGSKAGQDTVLSMNDRGQVIRMTIPHGDTVRDIVKTSDMPLIDVMDDINGNVLLF
ncbi:hypothetical protein J3Q64DRAFT_1052058 [Phycomyces blakesleeanus]|uniref:Uncharacterized protein n=1 Tax=Phycomyces blakesleeanus TaxID=4837 RepID=A0ABR3BEF0_PHYBL